MTFVLALGDMAAEALQSAGHDRVRAVRDEFSFGPLGDLTQPAEFTEARARYWSEAVLDLPQDDRPQAEADRQDIRDFLAEDSALLSEAFGSGEPVEVWASESLQDLMFLAACAALSPSAAPLALRRPGPGRRPPGAGIGGVSLEQLIWPAEPHRLSEAEIDGLRAFWQALTAPDMQPLRDFAIDPPQSPTGLAAAAAARLARLPHGVTGLDSVETRMLDELASLGAGPSRVSRIIGGALQKAADGPDLTGDLSMHFHLKGLADPALPRPLVTLDGDGTMRGTFVELTPFGSEVVARRADRVAANGWRIELGGLSVDAPPNADVPRAPV